jgi:hypothetical protein
LIQPETQFVIVGDDRVAYQVMGDGPRDVVYTTGFWSHLDIEWEDPGMARFLPPAGFLLCDKAPEHTFEGEAGHD